LTDLSVQLAPVNKRGLLLSNPVMTASGTCGYGIEITEQMDIQRLGAIICKGTTMEARDGNPQPRIIETENGVLNSVGLQNDGVDKLIIEKAPVWADWKVPVIVNIAGATIDEYAGIARNLNKVKGISGLEVNISCPNVNAGGMEFGSNAAAASRVTGAVKAETDLPVIVKLSPNVTDILEIALAVEDAGADAITLINTLRGIAIDVNTGKPVLGNIFGGLSGPAIKPVALYMVYRVSQKIGIPVIGCGGISNTDDAVEFMMAGASAVQVGTAGMINPGSTLDIIDGLRIYGERKKLHRLDEIVGRAWKQ
jgi:dihydroorotate dehydrogenase (NAD+) catalytic subunit